MSTKTAAKIPATSITLTRAEGLISQCNKPVTFSSGAIWKDAIAWLWSQGHTFPEDGSHTVEFVVTFEDGATYSGQLECEHFTNNGFGADYDIARHMLRHLGFVSGSNKPAHMSDSAYDRIVRRFPEVQAKAQKWLADYQIGA